MFHPQNLDPETFVRLKAYNLHQCHAQSVKAYQRGMSCNDPYFMLIWTQAQICDYLASKKVT